MTTSKSMPDFLRCAIYGRVSDDEAASRQHGSLEQQLHMGKDLANSLTHATGIIHEVIYTLIEEKAMSGGTTNRPKYKELMSLIKNQKIDVVIAKEISRISRSVLDFCDLMQLCEKNGVTVRIKNLDVDPNTPMGKAMFQMIAVIAELERSLTRERTKSSVRSAMKNNAKINGGITILGFRKDELKKGVWHPLASEIDQVKMIFESFCQTQSYRETCKIIEQHGIKNRTGKPYNAQSLKNLLSNRKYIGKLNIPDQEEDVDLPFGAVIPVELFEKAQQTIAAISTKHKHKNRAGKSRIYPLTGLLIFEDGTPFKGTSGTGRSGEKFYYYRNLANDITLNAPAIEQAVIEALRIFENDDKMVELAQTLRKSNYSKLEILEGQIQQAKRKMTDIEKNEDKHISAFAEMDPLIRKSSQTTLERKLKDFEQQRLETKKQIDTMQEQMKSVKSEVIDPKQLRKSLKCLFDKLHKADGAIKRGIFRQLFTEIKVFKNNHVHVSWAVPNVNDGGQVFVPGVRWLLRTGSNRRPSD